MGGINGGMAGSDTDNNCIDVKCECSSIENMKRTEVGSAVTVAAVNSSGGLLPL